MPTKQTNKGKKFPPEVYTADEMQRILKACSRRGPAGIRNKALIVIGWRCGLRLSEALALQPKDVDLVGGSVRVLKGKGGKTRTVPIDETACAVVELWVRVRKELMNGNGGKRPLFCTISKGDVQSVGGAVTTAYVRGLMRRIETRADLDKRLHFHGFRHTCAYELHYVERHPVGIVQKLLGHASLHMTSAYLLNIAPLDLAAIREREWTFAP